MVRERERMREREREREMESFGVFISVGPSFRRFRVIFERQKLWFLTVTMTNDNNDNDRVTTK